MTFLRSFARPVLLAWLLVFALILAGPASVLAKVEMVNGRDGAEGDPGDSFGAAGGGGGDDADGGMATTGTQPAILRKLPVLFLFDPRLGAPVMFIYPVTLQDISWETVIVRGGAK